MQTNEVIGGWNSERAAIEVKRAGIEKRIAGLKERLDALPRRTGHEALAVLGAAIVAEMPGRTCEILGPFGLDSSLGMHFSDENGEVVSSFTVRIDKSSDLWKFSLVDHSGDTGEYPAGSIGRRSRLHNPDIPLPATIDEMVAMLRKQESERIAE